MIFEIVHSINKILFIYIIYIMNMNVKKKKYILLHKIIIRFNKKFCFIKKILNY